MFFLVLFAFVASGCFILYRRVFYWKFRGVDQLGGYEALMCILAPFYRAKSYPEHLADFYNEYPEKRYTGMYQFYRPTLMIKDPDLIRQITVKDFEYFTDHMTVVKEGVEPIWENNLFSLKGEKWRDMRTTLTPSFTSSKMRAMFTFMCECASEFVKSFEEQNADLIETEMKDSITRFTNDVIASTAFGIECNSLKERENDFYMMGKQLTKFGGAVQNLKFALTMLSPTLMKLFGVSLFDREATNFFKKIVATNVETRERENIVRPDMIQLLMEARKAEFHPEIKKDSEDDGCALNKEEPNIGKDAKRPKLPFTLTDLTAQAFIFFFAGFDSVSTVLCFLCHELALNPDIQRRLQDEIDATWEEYRAVTYDGVTKMKYMDMVINETFRKWPAVAAVDRACNVSYTIQPIGKDEKPVNLLKDEVVLLPIFAIHRDPEYYPDPEKFDPERFSNENKGNLRPYTYFPFGVGPRVCIANRFSLLEMKALAFQLLRAFDIVPTAKMENPISLNKVAFNLQGDQFWVGLKRRRYVQLC